MKITTLQKYLITITYAILMLLFVGLNLNIASAEETSTPLRDAQLLEGEQLTDEERARRRARREARLLEGERLTDEERRTRRVQREEQADDTRAIQVDDTNIKPRISESERTRLKALAREKRMGEIIPARKERMQIRRDEIHIKFEETKNEILDKVKKGEITRKAARKLIFQAKEDIIVNAKVKIQQEKKQIQQENLSRLKNIIQIKLDSKLSKLNTLSITNQNSVYQKLIDKINSKLDLGTLSKKKNILMNIIKDILLAKKSTLN
ncbi:hypothetical protein A9Q91_04355 [Candidatus Gracilibacteria bacterium 28_42_T64]|nr:hypothetical protein A9Q91_04355 [Candidatus Gracilibacteria bacterium 28_42_T64]